jgi:N-acylglucosamine 2-epimerase
MAAPVHAATASRRVIITPSMPVGEYAARLEQNLFESVIPFWMKHSLDRKCGGYFTCLDRDGSVYDDRKYIWLQGRQVWTLAKLYNDVEHRADWLEAARLGVAFLEAHARDPEGRCYFSLTREGAPVFYQRKPYGAVFVMLGLLEYAKAAGDEKSQRQAIGLFALVRKWIASPGLLGRPALAGAPVLTQLADIYVMASMGLELYRATGDPIHKQTLRECLDAIKPHYDASHRLLMENAGPDLRRYPEGRLVCVGSIFEIAWFFLEILEILPDPEIRTQMLGAIEGALEFGWDKECGGFYYFQDLENRPTLQLESQMKLWWVHAEALCCLAHAYVLTKDQKWMRWLEQVTDYIFGHFVDPAYGEWFGYLDRQGNVTHTLKGNNYKGCFHIPRALLLSSRKLRTLSE